MTLRLKMFLASVLVFALAWVAILNLWVVRIDTPCNTFVSESGPNQTPALEHEGNQWYLMISFTPAPENEAFKVFYSTWLGERIFEVSSTGRRFKASSNHGLFRIRLESKEQSREVLNDLCFNK
ncbi:MAG: hypothetical protein V4445_09870 [Pseudomonadota bacterium]